MSFAPFDCLVFAEQTQAGLLKKEDSEVDVLVLDDIELRSANTEPMVPLDSQHRVDVTKSNGKWVDRSPGLRVQLTTHRLVFWDAHRTARFLHHSQMLLVTPETAYFKSPKLLFSTAALGDLYLAFARDKVKARDEFHSALDKALKRQEWETAVAPAVQVSRRPRRVGVDAILTQNAQRHKQAAHLTDTAFTGDSETLLKEAKDLVSVIHKYVATLDRQKETAGDSSEDAAQLVGMLQNMGMTSALTKADFKGKEDAYLEQVARELADFLRPRFTETVTVLTLTDIYCWYNRARASHLLSPEDLTKALTKCGELQLGMSVTTFPSGLTVLQDDSRADPQHLAARFRKLLEQLQTDSLTPMEVSRQWRISAVLASEQLQAVERLGQLVRDETLESLRFFPNRFEEWKDW